MEESHGLADIDIDIDIDIETSAGAKAGVQQQNQCKSATEPQSPGFFGFFFAVVHDQPDATVPLPAPVRVPTALRYPAQRVRPDPSEQPERQDRVRAQRFVEAQDPSGSDSGIVLEVLVESREVLAPSNPVPAVGVDPALVLRVDEQRRLQVCARSRVRGLGVGFQVVGGRRVASNFFSKVGFQ